MQQALFTTQNTTHTYYNREYNTHTVYNKDNHMKLVNKEVNNSINTTQTVRIQCTLFTTGTITPSIVYNREYNTHTS